ncbi:MAG: hypothetical protein J6S67_22145 [Methanobrevibacter sp.]|nr:hypothetical protein [Methanobrevibacter sp.]
MKTFIKDLTPETVIKRLRQGEVLTADTGKTIELIDGLLIAKDAGDWAVGVVIGTRDITQMYFDDPEPQIEIKIGGFYRTRDDRKAFVFSKNSEGKYCVVIENELPYTVFEDGAVFDYDDDNKDLIEVWIDKPVIVTRGKYCEVIDMLKAGKTYDYIKQECNVSKNTIIKLKKEMGLPVRSRKGKEKYEEIRDLISKGYKNQEIADKLGFKYATIANFIWQHPELKRSK